MIFDYTSMPLFHACDIFIWKLYANQRKLNVEQSLPKSAMVSFITEAKRCWQYLLFKRLRLRIRILKENRHMCYKTKMLWQLKLVYSYCWRYTQRLVVIFKEMVLLYFVVLLHFLVSKLTNDYICKFIRQVGSLLINISWHSNQSFFMNMYLYICHIYLHGPSINLVHAHVTMSVLLLHTIVKK